MILKRKLSRICEKAWSKLTWHMWRHFWTSHTTWQILLFELFSLKHFHKETDQTHLALWKLTSHFKQVKLIQWRHTCIFTKFQKHYKTKILNIIVIFKETLAINLFLFNKFSIYSLFTFYFPPVTSPNNQSPPHNNLIPRHIPHVTPAPSRFPIESRKVEENDAREVAAQKLIQ